MREDDAMVSAGRLDIAGISIALSEPEAALARLDGVFAELGERLMAYAADARNTVLCRAGCSHCCRSGGFFAMTLVEALRLNRAAATLREPNRSEVIQRADALRALQRDTFANDGNPPDVPGARDEATFSARVSAVTRTHPVCPLLEGELCSVYADRPFLCRAYGYATDAYVVRSNETMVFRSLCVLYEGVALRDYVRARELRAALTGLSIELAGGRNVGRFTLPEAILARETCG